MARPLIPSLSALTAFESAGRHLSFSRAAQELHLTQGAVSRQVIQLEEMLGMALFERVNQRVFLTDKGRRYLQDVQKILSELTDVTLRARASAASGGILTLGVLPTFATRWMLPRLTSFLGQYPGVTVNFAVRLEPFAFAGSGLDAAVHHGEPTWPGAVCVHLCDEAVIPVAAPAFLARHGWEIGRDALAAVAGMPRLHQVTRPTAWRDWFAAQGIESSNPFAGARFDQFGMIAAAATAGLGAALIPRFLIEDELASGRLVVLDPKALSLGTAYWYVYPEENAGNSLVRAFGDWLKALTGS